MKFTFQEMSIGEVLDRAVKLFFGRLPALLAIQAVVYAPVLILQLTLPDVAVGPLGVLLIFGPLVILGPIGSAATLRIIAQEYLEQPIGIGEAFTFALGRFLPLLGTSILAGLGIVVGMLACCVPGIYLAVVWAFISQVVVMENLSGPDALARSKGLVAGHFGRVFVVVLLLAIAVNIVNAIINTSFNVALPFLEVVPGNNPFAAARVNNFTNYAIVQLVQTAVGVLGGMFIAVCTTVLYFDLRNRKEAFNIDALVAWSDQYRTWRDEPDVALPPPAAGPADTGIKPADGGPPPETGIKDAGGDAPKPPPAP
ncbi:MAG: hypothetical protein HY289_03665 [Planctomycetes bacterium]|nr:hypothetical protein [Planctomycetota bacterium]